MHFFEVSADSPTNTFTLFHQTNTSRPSGVDLYAQLNLPAGLSLRTAACLFGDAVKCIAGTNKASKAASKTPPKAKKAASPRKKPVKEASPPKQALSDVEVSLSEAEEDKLQASSSSLEAAGNISPQSCLRLVSLAHAATNAVLVLPILLVTQTCHIHHTCQTIHQAMHRILPVQLLAGAIDVSGSPWC